ncbi:MAG: hypothetical protein PHX61_12125 [Alphaproteobacteria bacterium]|nr:hypothetical protein [Alphaproteobacteria bacterium]
MGSLTSRPKASSQSAQVVYAAPVETTTTVSSEADPAEVAAARAENVLRRKRSVLGNVLTSFRGVLSTGNNLAARKTLLGE